MTKDEKLQAILTDIDQVNRQDPRLVESEGSVQPYELLYGHRMTEMLHAYKPDAGTFLQIAARGQHIGRWNTPRNDYPMDRQGYLKWRSKLKIYHAEVLAELMRKREFSPTEVESVRSLIIKKGLRSVDEAAILEDVVCFVFLMYYLEEFAAQHEEAKVIDILRKTWNKMTAEGQQRALSMELPVPVSKMVEKALSS